MILSLLCAAMLAPPAPTFPPSDPIPYAPSPSVATVPDTSIAHTLRMLTESGHNPYLSAPDYPDYVDEMAGLYAPAGFELLWFDGTRPKPQARALIDVLSEAHLHGLDPEAYDAARYREFFAGLAEGGAPHPTEFALIDGGLSVGFLRYLSDLHIGRVDPANLHFGFNIEQKKLDLASIVSDAVAKNEVRGAAARVEPAFPQYRRMLQVLAEYRQLAELSLPVVPETGTVHPGDAYVGTGELAELLVALGDLPTGTAGNGATYDGELVAGVERFQSRHGLEADGILGKATFAHLNTPIADRVEQIELALERLRWLPDVENEPWILVNIPAFELWVLDPEHPDHRIALDMRVIVGKALNKQTPAFRGDMHYVVMSPYWNIPYGIAVNEILPRATRDPEYISSRGLQIVREFTWDSPPLPATPENLAAIRSGRLKVRQMPGPGNALGRAKFIFPNADNVYLHDTPAHELFSRTRRDFSHGCIRLERPQELAEWVLRDQEAWSPESIGRAMSAEEPTRADLETPLPVILFYTTVMSDESQPHFFDDIYGHDRVLEAALQHGHPYPS
jgi:murein L,D-transpeptidase YcbB/YkuD